MNDDQNRSDKTTRSPIWQIEFIGDGNAIVRRADDSETLLPASDVADFLREEFQHD